MARSAVSEATCGPSARSYPRRRRPPAGSGSEQADGVSQLGAILPITQAIITSLDPDAVLHTLVQKTKELSGVRASAVFEYDEASSRLKVRCSCGLSESYARFIIIPVGALAVGRAFQSGELVVVDDIDADPSFAPTVRRRMHREHLDAVLAAPLMARQKLLGVLTLYFDRNHSPGQYDTSIVRTLANLAAVALDNARLFQAQIRATQELEALSKRLAEQSEMLGKSVALHEWLVRTVLARNGLDAVCGALAQHANATVVVEDTRLNVLSVSRSRSDPSHPDLPAESVGLARAAEAQPVQDHLARVRGERRPHLLPAIPEIGLPVPRITAPVYVGENLLAYVSVLSLERPFGPLDAVVAEQGAIAIALEMMKSKVAFDAEQRVRGDFLQTLLAGRISDLTEWVAAMATSGFDLSNLKRVLVVRPDRDDGASCNPAGAGSGVSVRPQIFDVVEKAVLRRCPKSMVVATSSSFTVLLSSEEKSLSESAVRDLGEEIVSTVARSLAPTTVSVGIGGPCQDLRAVRRSYEEAKRALDMGAVLGRKGSVVSYSELGVFELLLKQSKPEELREFAGRYLGALVAYDRRRKSGLLQTLVTYLRNNYCLNDTASDLFLHPNTVKYRLQKIEKLCGVDLQSAEDRMNLQVALRLHQLACGELSALRTPNRSLKTG